MVYLEILVILRSRRHVKLQDGICKSKSFRWPHSSNSCIMAKGASSTSIFLLQCKSFAIAAHTGHSAAAGLLRSSLKAMKPPGEHPNSWYVCTSIPLNLYSKSIDPSLYVFRKKPTQLFSVANLPWRWLICSPAYLFGQIYCSTQKVAQQLREIERQ